MFVQIVIFVIPFLTFRIRVWVQLLYKEVNTLDADLVVASTEAGGVREVNAGLMMDDTQINDLLLNVVRIIQNKIKKKRWTLPRFFFTRVGSDLLVANLLPSI
jgi:hypothetical protein